MAYRIELKPAAERDLKRIPNADQKRIARKISALSEDPRPPGAMKLKQAKELWRIRVGEYRILYQVQDGVSLILIARIRHRRQVYRQF